MHDILVNEIMTIDVRTCLPGTPLHDVVKELHAQSFSCLVICEGDLEPLGIITERDMVIILADMLDDVMWDNLSVDNFMTSPIVTVGEDLTLFEAVDIARTHNIRHIPVIDHKGHLSGLLTQTDIVNGYYQASINI